MFASKILKQSITSSTFLPGAYFDLRVELHAYDTDTSKPVPDAYTQFKTTVRKNNGKWVDIEKFFELEEKAPIENWNFDWINSADVKYANIFNTSAEPVEVAVAARAWRKLKFDKPGTYDVSVQYGPKDAYTVRYTVIEVYINFQKLQDTRPHMCIFGIAKETKEEGQKCDLVYRRWV